MRAPSPPLLWMKGPRWSPLEPLTLFTLCLRCLRCELTNNQILALTKIFFGLAPYFEPQISLRRPLILNKILIEN